MSDSEGVSSAKGDRQMKNKGKLIYCAVLMALLFAAAMSGCGGGGGTAATSGSGTLSGSAK